MLELDAARKEQLRRGAIAAGVALVFFAGAFSTGRFSAPLKVETRDVEKVVFKDRVEWREKVVERVVVAKVETKVVWRDRIIEVGGRIVEHEVEKTGATTTAEKDTSADSSRVEVREVERVKLVDRLVTLQPRWRVAVLAGAQWPTPLIPLYGPLVLGLEGDFRIVGGLSVGLWLNTGGAAGVALALEF